MNWSYLIKRSWQITWRYKALWVLGLFAGISGCQPGGGGSGGGGNRFSTGSGDGLPFDPSSFPSVDRILLLVIVGAVVLFLVGLVWAVFGIAARGGLVVAADWIESGQDAPLGRLWGAGFSRWFTLFGLELLLKLPILLVIVALIAAIAVPLIAATANGGDPRPEVLAPVCGSLLVGFPALIVLSLVLGILYLLAVRFVMLSGMGVTASIGAAWQTLRARFKDVFVMYFLSGALNLAASLVVAVPAALIGLAVAFPMIAALRGNADWSLIAGPIAVGVLALVAVSFVYSAIWGTYSSTIWTLFFRQLLAPAVPLAPPVAGPAWPSAPAPPEGPITHG